MSFNFPSEFKGIHFSNRLEAGDIGSIIALHGKLYFEEFGFDLGRFLFSLFMDHIRVKGYSQICLWTTSNLKMAAHLYQQEGFQITEERQSDNFGMPLIEQKYSWEDNGQ